MYDGDWQIAKIKVIEKITRERNVFCHTVPRNINTVHTSESQLHKTESATLIASQPEQYLMFSFCSAGEMLPPKCISVDLRGENCWGRGPGCSEDYEEVPLEWVPELFPGLHSLCVATRGPGVSLSFSFERSCANFATQFLNSLTQQTALPVHRKHVLKNILGRISFRQLNRDY